MSRECLRFMKTFQVKYPIVQAPMAGVSTPEMASAVSRSGGLGSLSLSHINLQEPSSISAIRKITDGFESKTGANPRSANLNFFCHPIYPIPTLIQKENWNRLYGKLLEPENLDLSLSFNNGNVSFKTIETPENAEIFQSLLTFFANEFTPGMVSFHFGCPSSDSIQKLKKLGIAIFVTATNEFEGEELIKLGVDGIVCQGFEAGGHRGSFPDSEAKFDEGLSTLCLFKRLKAVKKKMGSETFLIPAGGIMDSRTIQFYLDEGASACQLGTAFLAAAESKSSTFYQKLLKSHDSISTTITPIPSGLPARTLLTPFIERLSSLSQGEDLPPYGYRYSEFKLLRSKFPSLVNFNLCGQGVDQIQTGNDKCLSTAEIFSGLTQGLIIPKE
ncbi:LAFA_0D00276g1_1 [Lachancea sp. 'fantastica']|nr:LAFA_0D00276g1_1 [Lachancea sp. 'fantastica']